MNASRTVDRKDSEGLALRKQRGGYRAAITLVWLVIIGLVVYYQSVTAHLHVPAASTPGRAYGLVGLILFLLLSLYGVRRVVYLGRYAPLAWWYRAHMLLGALTLALLACHCGIAFRSPFLSALQIGFWGTVLTGVGGWAYQTYMARQLLQSGARPAMWKELEIERDQLQARLADAGEADGALRAELEQTEQALRSYRRLRAWTTVHLLFTVFGVQMALWHVWMVAVNPR